MIHGSIRPLEYVSVNLTLLQVSVEGGRVKVRADKKALETKKRIKAMCCGAPEEDKTYLIIGGGNKMR